MVDPLFPIKMASYISQLPSFFLLLSAVIQTALNLRVSTPPRVTVPIGGNVTIPCAVDSDLTVIYWSRGRTQSNSEQIVSRVTSELPSGVGLDSGDFDLLDDNSLVINHMRLKYESPYICIALFTSLTDDASVTEVIAIIKPRTVPTIKFSCSSGPCGQHLEEGDLVNLTCLSDEARPAVDLTWTDSNGIPIREIFNETRDGSQRDTFVTSSTIQYSFKRDTTLTCQADGDAVGEDSAEHKATINLMLKTTEAPNKTGTNPPNSRLDNYNGEAEKEGSGLELVTILMVAVAVSVLVVIILIVAVVVLYKKNQEYLDAISYSYCLSKDGYNSFFPRSGKSYHRAEPEDYIRGYNEMSNKL